MKPMVVGAAVGLVLAYLVGYNTIYARQRGQAQVIRQQIVQEQKDQRIQHETATVLQQMERYHTQLPQEPDPSWLVHEAMAASQQAGVDIASIQQDNPQVGKQFTRLAITLQFRATYHQLGAFLDRLERSGSFIRVDQLGVGTSKGESKKPSVQLTLSTIYVPSALTSDVAALAEKPQLQRNGYSE